MAESAPPPDPRLGTRRPVLGRRSAGGAGSWASSALPQLRLSPWGEELQGRWRVWDTWLQPNPRPVMPRKQLLASRHGCALQPGGCQGTGPCRSLALQPGGRRGTGPRQSLAAHTDRQAAGVSLPCQLPPQAHATRPSGRPGRPPWPRSGCAWLSPLPAKAFAVTELLLRGPRSPPGPPRPPRAHSD